MKEHEVGRDQSHSGSTIESKVSSHEDYDLVVATIEDYLYGLYEISPERIENSVDTSLRKVGFWYDVETNQYQDNLEMTYDQLYNLSEVWNQDGLQVTESSPRKITIYEINDKTAIGKLEAEWGFDYFQLAKVDNKWLIKNVIWQSYDID